jgi:hypothetical protein
MSVEHWRSDTVLGEKPVTVPLCPPQISHGLGTESASPLLVIVLYQHMREAGCTCGLSYTACELLSGFEPASFTRCCRTVFSLSAATAAITRPHPLFLLQFPHPFISLCFQFFIHLSPPPPRAPWMSSGIASLGLEQRTWNAHRDVGRGDQPPTICPLTCNSMLLAAVPPPLYPHI